MKSIKPVLCWDDVPVVMDIGWICRLLGKSYETIKKMCQSKKIPAFKVGAEWRAEKESIRSWIEESQKGA